ncbi:hypothetical protein L1987_55022 [Smallanthus sonchifolius]|uniref:Uncharacterized protein n=1 Tax=Smallanthus sonchifolius TaxID=185202 RepID=A0ACB9E949_9ASTR|nr:hypothetical protein L1987_55022 [Smallanthus sonchifolius]
MHLTKIVLQGIIYWGGMARDRELSRSPSYKRRRYSRSPSPAAAGHRYSSRRYRSQRDRRSRSPYSYSR